MVIIANDVQLVVKHLQATLGSTWQQASVARSAGASRLVTQRRVSKPWESVAKAANHGSLARFSERHIRARRSRGAILETITILVNTRELYVSSAYCNAIFLLHAFSIRIAFAKDVRFAF
eukprot:6185309-Pleurochrysis_carterae.AAC.2